MNCQVFLLPFVAYIYLHLYVSHVPRISLYDVDGRTYQHSLFVFNQAITRQRGSWAGFYLALVNFPKVCLWWTKSIRAETFTQPEMMGYRSYQLQAYLYELRCSVNSLEYCNVCVRYTSPVIPRKNHLGYLPLPASTAFPSVHEQLESDDDWWELTSQALSRWSTPYWMCSSNIGKHNRRVPMTHCTSFQSHC